MDISLQTHPGPSQTTLWVRHPAVQGLSAPACHRLTIGPRGNATLQRSVLAPISKDMDSHLIRFNTALGRDKRDLDGRCSVRARYCSYLRVTAAVWERSRASNGLLCCLPGWLVALGQMGSTVHLTRQHRHPDQSKASSVNPQ